MQIAQHTFVVSGAGSGLGAATARHLVQQGAQVVVLDINRQAVMDQASALGRQALGIELDICDAGAAEQALRQAREQFGALHGLVNCAGLIAGSRILGRDGPHDLELFNRVLQVNVGGSFNLLRLASSHMADNEPDSGGERGVIINTASVAAFEGQLGQAAYAASKGAVASLTLPAARELARVGVRVMCIAPGIFETPMMAGLTEEVRNSLCAGVPFPARLGRPDEYAALVQHVVENSMLNGEIIRLDGALRMGIK